MMGGLIMCHGDDAGLRVPPRIAGTQVVVMVVRDDDAGSVTDAARRLAAELTDAGCAGPPRRRRSPSAFGRRATDWELKGVPVRVELGPRDVRGRCATVVRRDEGGKFPLPLGGAAAGAIPGCSSEIQAALLAEATGRSVTASTPTVATVDEAIEAAQAGFARLPWSSGG